MRTTLRFLGAAETVTGSRSLLTVARERGNASRVLVDCGLFQGWKRMRARNWGPARVRPDELDALVLTHAHIDHSGFVPRLLRMGFRHPVWCSPGTRDLLKILWPDAGYLQEEQARHANRHGWSRHRPAEPLYTRDDAVRALGSLKVVDFDTPFEPAPGVQAQLTRAGHILGAASVHLSWRGGSVFFSGDVGRPVDPIMRPPSPALDADTLVVESTYGDRRHPSVDIATVLADVVNDTAAKRGAVVIPAFAVGRSQHVLHILAELRQANRIPDIPMFLDSPMAIDATQLYRDHQADHRLDPSASRRMCEVASLCRSAEESKAIDRRSGPMIVISASGMATGGRILHHLVRFLPDEKNAVVFVGFQAAGTRGRTLVDGGEAVKIHGDYVPARARIVQVDALSAHADHVEITRWLRDSGVAPKRVFINHGEPSAADAMRRRVEETLACEVDVPEDGSTWALD
jgi:metallo-beta-lactamase family protein